MASTCKYFEEDAVFRHNKKGEIEFGLVLENSEFVSSDDEESDDRTLTDWEPMKRGQIRVAWHPRGKEEVLLEKKVKLFDRSLMPGDIVRRLVKGKDTQLGYCRSTHVNATVQLVGSKQVINNVPSKDLLPLEDFSADIAVFLNSWVGIIKVVRSDITMKSTDGSHCILSDDDALDLDDVLERRDRVSEFRKYSFYPGQMLWGPVHCFEKARWLNKSKEVENILHKPGLSLWVTVKQVKVVSMDVQWLCRAYCEGANVAVNEVVEQPKSTVTGEDIDKVKMMHIFESSALQTGDRNYYVVKETDKLVSLDEWKKEILLNSMVTKDGASLVNNNNNKVEVAKRQQKETCLVKEAKVEASDEVNGTISVGGCDSDDFEDMEDEDGGNTSDSGSATSRSTASSDSWTIVKSKRHKKKAVSLATKVLQKKKLRRARKKLVLDTIPVKPGDQVVTETLVTETKSDVVWQDGSIEDNIPSSSLYPIHHLDGHEFFPGDFVLENIDQPKSQEYGVIKQVDHTGRTAEVTWVKTYLSGSDPNPVVVQEEEVSVYDIKDHPDFRYRPGSCVIRVANFQDTNPENTAGQVLNIHPTGKVEVHWVSGNKSCCYPQELYRIGEYDSDDLWGENDSGDEEDNSWETESEDSNANSDLSNDDHPEDSKSNLKSLGEETSTAIKQRLLNKIEKLRENMVQIEEVFVQDPSPQNSTIMRRLLEIYKHCCLLDKLLGTFYFQEKHLQGLVGDLCARGRINSARHMMDQMARLFSNVHIDPLAEGKKKKTGTLSEQHVQEFLDLDSSSDAKIAKEPLSADDSEGGATCNASKSNHCQELFQLLRVRLLKAHEDLQQVFGMDAATNDAFKESTSNENSPKHVPNPSDAATVGPIAEPNQSENQPVEKKEEQEPEEESNQEGVLSKEEEMRIMSTAGQGVFSLMESVPDTHKFMLSIFQPVEPKCFFRTVKKEMQLLRSSLPDGIVVKAFEDRMDLFSVLIKGSKRTPYEDGIFLFDFQLPAVYPKSPPLCHFVSYCSDRLNPNLYEGGKVCVSLLGTWGGKGTEVWNPLTSTLLQVIVSIQGLILVSEPYYNEAGYERQRGTQQGNENSRMYNEMVLLKLVQSTAKLITNPSQIFQQEIMQHFKENASRMVLRLEKWLTVSETWNESHPLTPASPTVFRQLHQEEFLPPMDDNKADEALLPEYPLLPASKGFCLTLRKCLIAFKETLLTVNIDI